MNTSNYGSLFDIECFSVTVLMFDNLIYAIVRRNSNSAWCGESERKASTCDTLAL